jgi:hypothetical protein
MKPKTLENWIWVLIYGGLLCLVAGIAVERQQETLGQAMVWIGGIVAAVGAVLIVVRARIQ